MSSTAARSAASAWSSWAAGSGLPSLVAARAGAAVLATDESDEALELLRRNAADNGVCLDFERVDWHRADALMARAPFDRVLAADVLYEQESVEPLLSLLPRLAPEVWLADPGRAPAADFLAAPGEPGP